MGEGPRRRRLSQGSGRATPPGEKSKGTPEIVGDWREGVFLDRISQQHGRSCLSQRALKGRSGLETFF